MMTALLQLLVFVIAGCAFAAYVLWVDRKEHSSQAEPKPDDAQASIHFPEDGRDEDDVHRHRGAAMSRS